MSSSATVAELPATSGPFALPPVAFVLYCISVVGSSALDPDAKKLLQYHVMLLQKSGEFEGDFVFAACETFRFTRDEESLRAALRMWSNDRFSRGGAGGEAMTAGGSGVGLPTVVPLLPGVPEGKLVSPSASGAAGRTAPASPPRPSDSVQDILKEREAMMMARRNVARLQITTTTAAAAAVPTAGGSHSAVAVSDGSTSYSTPRAVLEHADAVGGGSRASLGGSLPPPLPAPHAASALSPSSQQKAFAASAASLSSAVGHHHLPQPAPALVPVTLVYYSPEMASVAEELMRGPAAPFIRLRTIDWKSFPDSFPNLFIHDLKDCRFHSVLFLASFHSPAVIFSNLSVINVLPAYARRLTVLIPWFSTGTYERVTQVGEVATAKTLARMLSATPTAGAGPTSFTILDIHALSEQFFFGDSVHLRLKSCVQLLIDRLLRLPDVAKIKIAFPDDGAYKRFGTKFTAFGDAVICSKRRDGDIRRVVVSEGDPRGMHCVIVDDLVQSGGTLIECAKALLAAGASDVSAFCTHAVFPNEAWKKFLPSPSPSPSDSTSASAVPGFRFFWVTNTVPTTAAVLSQVGAPFEVLSIAPLVADMLLGS